MVVSFLLSSIPAVFSPSSIPTTWVLFLMLKIQRYSDLAGFEDI